MTPVVVDSSVAIKWFVVEPYSSDAHRMLTAYQDGLLTFLAPDLLYAEVGNILWKKCRFQGMNETDAREILDTFAALMIRGTPAAILLNEAFQLAIGHQRTVYDALYLALSLREQCPLVTADEKFFNAMRSVLVNLIWIEDWSPPATPPLSEPATMD